jgi:hypothetical protein
MKISVSVSTLADRRQTAAAFLVTALGQADAPMYEAKASPPVASR